VTVVIAIGVWACSAVTANSNAKTLKRIALF
jgi:hypothetical protein